MKPLKQALIEETQDLKERFLQQTQEWAEARFAFLMKASKFKELDWCKYFGLTAELANYRGTDGPIAYDPKRKLEGSQFWSMPRGFYNTKTASEQWRLESEFKSALRRKKEGYLQDAHNKAVHHYDMSIDKLIGRLFLKGIKDGEVNIKKGWVGVNLEMVISVNQVKVKAWTIVAQGEIQRPHYRYLVK